MHFSKQWSDHNDFALHGIGKEHDLSFEINGLLPRLRELFCVSVMRTNRHQDTLNTHTHIHTHTHTHTHKHNYRLVKV